MISIARLSALLLLVACGVMACAHPAPRITNSASATAPIALTSTSCPPADPVADTLPGQVRRFSPGGHLDHNGRQFFFEFEVARTATARADSPVRAAVGRGRVLAQFMVDTTGLVEPGSWRAVEASDSALVQAVIAALPTLRFTPAEHHAGCRVRQLVQQPFVFR